MTATHPSTARNESTHEPPCSRVLAVGCATPGLCWKQSDISARMAMVWKLQGSALDRWERIVAGSGIETRYGVLPPDVVAPMTTSQRMAAFEEHSPEIAARAACAALAKAGVPAARVTDVVVVSCTGFAAPGLDVALIERLGLPMTTRRTMIGFMGCFGAINGLRVASGLCAADPDAVAVLVCAELCSLHMRLDDSPANLVASALFADGAAAAVIAGANIGRERLQGPMSEAAKSHGQPVGIIGPGATHLFAEGRDWMSWRVTDSGFAMTLTRDVPVALRRGIRSFADRLSGPDEATYIVHPGGPGVLDAVDSGLELDGKHGIEHSRAILRSHGNMSSATTLFVLERALGGGLAPPMILLAFGPGLTIEGLRLEPAPASIRGCGCANNAAIPG